jgi:DNA-binding MarR family transcriptional regulator
MTIEETDSFELLLSFFKTLADATRLRIVGVLASRDRGEAGVDELATQLDLTPPTVSHHLTKLRLLGLVTMRASGTSHLYSLDPDRLEVMARELLSIRRIVVEKPTYDEKVLRDVTIDGSERLLVIPRGYAKRQVVLRWLASKFDAGRAYTEAEVNAILGRHHDDVAFLRRELVSSELNLMTRDKGVYVRVSP